MFIDGDTIYSYGRHFPIATWGPRGVVYVTTQRYSVSTARHISLVRQALNESGIAIVMSDRFENGKVAVPKPEEIAAREKSEAEEVVREQEREKKRELRRQKQVERERVQSPEQAQDVVHLEQPDESGVPVKHRVDRTLAPQTTEDVGKLPALTPEQWMSRIQDMEDQMLRETDPARREKLRQRIERMRQAAARFLFEKKAFSEEPVRMDNALADISDLTEVLHDQNEQINSGKKKDSIKLENKLPQMASIQSKGFGDLLLMIEQGGPGIPSEIGKRLYRADGVVSRHSA